MKFATRRNLLQFIFFLFFLFMHFPVKCQTRVYPTGAGFDVGIGMEYANNSAVSKWMTQNASVKIASPFLNAEYFHFDIEGFIDRAFLDFDMNVFGINKRLGSDFDIGFGKVYALSPTVFPICKFNFGLRNLEYQTPELSKFFNANYYYQKNSCYIGCSLKTFYFFRHKKGSDVSFALETGFTYDIIHFHWKYGYFIRTGKFSHLEGHPVYGLPDPSRFNVFIRFSFACAGGIE